MMRIFVESPLSNIDRSHNQRNAANIKVEETFVFRVDVQLLFENVGRNKKIYTKCKSEKLPEVVQHPVIVLKMQLLVKFVNDFKL